MKQITIISGKGGTGKTSFVAAFAGLCRQAVIADCDVDAADLHLILTPTVEQVEEFRSGYEPVLSPEWCSACGECAAVCRFGAVRLEPVADRPEWLLPRFDTLACEGCGFCVDVCPTDAIALQEKIAGDLFVSRTRFGPMVHASLGIAQATSGKLVSLVRTRAQEVAERDTRNLILIDGPPGIGCSVIASLTGVDAALIVSEPTVSGLHDLQRVAELCRHFKIQAYTVVNKWDLNPEMTKKIEELSASEKIAPLGRVPFDPGFVRAMVAGKTIIEHDDSTRSAVLLESIWGKLDGK